MQHWRVVLLAIAAVLFLVAGLALLVMPDAYEGRELYRFDAQHALRVLDLLGGAAIGAGCVLAWLAGLLWQRRMYGTE